MKQIYFLPVLLLLMLISCQQEETGGLGDKGYLRLEVSAVTSTNTTTKSVPDNYKPKQLAVQIVNEKGVIVKSTDNYEEWKGTEIELSVGTYTIRASSNGFDGLASGFDIPYYVGSTTVTITENTSSPATVTCTLANVKVTVKFDQSFINSFKSSAVSVSSKIAGISAQSFQMGKDNKSAYFPVGDLTALVSVVNESGSLFTQSDEITKVKARDHYILTYRVVEQGSSSITVVADDETKTYTYTFNVPVTSKTSLSAKAANAWSDFAYVEGSAISADGSAFDISKMTFEYQKEGASAWTSVVASQNGDGYKATLTGLTSNAVYSYRLAYKNGEEQYASDPVNFTTEAQSTIPNLSFDDWVKDGKHWYAASSVATKFWDSGNEGANTLDEINPTCPEYNVVKKGVAAKLWSTTAAGQFAAGSLFTGDFGKASVIPLGAKLNFGQPFTGRPSQLTGWFKYNPGAITHTKVNGISKNDRDSCSIYIALTDWTAPFAVSTGDNQFVDFTSSSIIAYGELSSDKTSPESMSDYEKFTIDIKYRSLTRKPTYVLVVCSSSKYGDYFTGSTSSVLYLDEFEFVYGEPVIDTNYIK